MIDVPYPVILIARSQLNFMPSAESIHSHNQPQFAGVSTIHGF
jgi:hypothetical protein